MKTPVRRSAFTLIEVLIVVVIMAILAATIIPQFTDSTKDAKASTATIGTPNRVLMVQSPSLDRGSPGTLWSSLPLSARYRAHELAPVVGLARQAPLAKSLSLPATVTKSRDARSDAIIHRQTGKPA